MDDCPICGGKSLVTTTRTVRDGAGSTAFKCDECLILWPTQGKIIVASCRSAMSKAH